MTPDPDRAATLVRVAREAIAAELGGPPSPRRGDAWLQAPRAVFVSLHEGGELRGCAGHLQARLPLEDAVRDAARAAAFEDPRFRPVGPAELDALDVEVTVLSPVERIDVDSEEELLARLRPGVDGVVLSWGARVGVFIPQMWEQLPDPRSFLRALKGKAGLPRDRWIPGTRVQRFTAEIARAPPPP